MRMILGLYSGMNASALTFRYGPYGKPELDNQSALRMNLTHSDNLALLAVTKWATIGIDVEQVRPLDNLHSLAARVFTDSERAVLQRAPTAKQQELFFLLWTRKEAFLKALGKPVTDLLRPLNFLFGVEDPDRDPSEAWYMHSFAPASGFVGSIVVASGPDPIEISWLNFGHDWRGTGALLYNRRSPITKAFGSYASQIR
jgi:4'-phosphopantetheinyl transferase